MYIFYFVTCEIPVNDRNDQYTCIMTLLLCLSLLFTFYYFSCPEKIFILVLTYYLCKILYYLIKQIFSFGFMVAS